jgi:protein SCO1
MTVQRSIKTLLALAAVILAACSSSKKETALPFYSTPDFTPQWLSQSDKEYEEVHTIAPFTFTNQEGKIISQKQVEGKVYVANFFFTRCGSICPKMNSNLKTVADTFAANDDVRILSHSVTPETDSVQQLAAYGKRNGINPQNWWLLTGDKEAIYNLARRSYFADEETGYRLTSNDFLHTENAVLIDRKGRIRGVYNATLQLEMQKLVEHINQLLKEE